MSTGYPGKGGGTIPDGLNNPALHDQIYEAFKTGIPLAKAAKVPNLITFFGNRKGMPDDQAIANCAAVLNRIKPIAEEHGVTVVVELLNSKVNHKDYQGDHTPFGVEVMKRVASPNVKLLYDIYHMQIMEGDIIRTIKDNKDWIAPLPHGRRPRPQRARPDAGAAVAGHRQGDSRDRLHRLLRARVHPVARADGVAARSRRPLRRVGQPTRHPSFVTRNLQ